MKFYLFTDGACQPNPGNGGWAFIVYPDGQSDLAIKVSGCAKNTTNNRMEITAVLEGLQKIIAVATDQKQPVEQIVLFADSKYILNGIQNWIHDWESRNWTKKDGKPVLNTDLWSQIHTIIKQINVKCNHVLGHSGHPENEECDRLAVEAIQRETP